MELTRKRVIEEWKVHRLPSSMKSEHPYYVGPKHGRLVVCAYATKKEAEMALEMKEWLIRYLKIKK